MLQSSVLVVGIIFLIATLLADLVLLAPQPPHPLRERANDDRRRPHHPDQRSPHGDEARIARRERIRLLLRSPAFIARLRPRRHLGDLRDLRRADRSAGPSRRGPAQRPAPRRAASTCSAPTASAATCSRASSWAPASILIMAPLATLLGTIVGTAIGLVTGYFRGLVDEASMRFVDALLSIPLIITALLAVVALGSSRVDAHPRDRPRLRADHRAHGAGRGAGGARARLRAGGDGSGTSARRTSCSRRSSRTSPRRSSSSSPCASATRSSPSRRSRSSASGSTPRSPTGAPTSPSNYQFINGGVWWAVLFPALAIATLVIGINLIADEIAQTYER